MTLDRGVEPGLALVQAEAVLPEPEILLHRPAQPCCPDQPRLGQQLALGHVAVVKGQLAGLQVAADQQVMARRGGGDPGPGVPALALGALALRTGPPTGACPSAAASPPPHRSPSCPAGEGEREVRGDPQHVGLPALLEELPQLGAAAVDLVPAGEIEGQPVGVGSPRRCPWPAAPWCGTPGPAAAR